MKIAILTPLYKKSGLSENNISKIKILSWGPLVDLTRNDPAVFFFVCLFLAEVILRLAWNGNVPYLFSECIVINSSVHDSFLDFFFFFFFSPCNEQNFFIFWWNERLLSGDSSRTSPIMCPLKLHPLLTINSKLAFKTASIKSETDELKKKSLPFIFVCFSITHFTWMYVTIQKKISVGRLATSISFQL